MNAEANDTSAIANNLMRRLKASAEKRKLTEQEAEKARKEQEARRKRERIEALREHWNAPEINVRFQPPNEGQWWEAWVKVREKLGKGVIIGMVGAEGRGKSQMAVEAMKHTTANLRTAYYETSTGIALALKQTFGGEGSELAVLRKLTTYSLLVIDEIDKMKKSGWSDTNLFYLLSKRHDALRDTIIMGNCQAQELKGILTEYILARMKQGGGIIECNWPSFRLGH